MLTCSWSGSTAPGANRISAVIRPVLRSNSSVLASQPGKRVFFPFHAVGADEMGMRICGLRALRRHGVHAILRSRLFWRDPSSFVLGRQTAGVRCGGVVALPA